MKILDPGVIGSSFIDFTIPSDFARHALYYCPQFGHFYCNNKYDIARESLDLFLLFYIRNGSLTIETQGYTYTAKQDEVVLLNCIHPHRYHCKDTCEFLWFHFNGSSSAAYTEYLTEQHNIVFSGEQIADLQRNFLTIHQRARSVVVNEHLLSLNIGQILCRLATANQRTIADHSILLPAINFIREHYSEQIDLNQLSEVCRISKPHLIRCFKKDMNCTPHEYLLAYRLRQSKHLLVSSVISIEEIAEQCGFNSASHFTRAFRQSTGFTPSAFRKMQF